MNFNWRKICVYPAFRIAGYRLFQEINTFNEYDKKSRPQILNQQTKRLINILKFSHEHVPYYNKLYNLQEIISGENINWEAFRKIPVLTKEIIRKTNTLYSSSTQKNDWQKNTSGGSTGQPIELIQDSNYRSKNIAFKLYIKLIAQQKVTDPELRLWGSENDILLGKEKFSIRFRNWLYNRVEFNSFRLDENQLFSITKKWNIFKPSWVETYVQSMHQLCRFVSENNIELYPPKAIVTTAGTLYEDIRGNIEDLIKCTVINRYGSREVGDMAFSCPEHKQMHLCTLNHYFEILDEQQNPVKPGQIGNVYITLLTNFAMPLIRYQVGDLAQAVENTEICQCGRSSPLIKKVVGRDVHLFKTKSGALIDGEYFTHLFYYKKWIQKFQVVQKGIEEIHLKIVKHKEPIQSEMKEIENGIRKLMGNTCNIKWLFPDSIPPLSNGKYIYTISELS